MEPDWSFLAEMRLQMAYAPRWIYVTRLEWHGKMQAHYEERVQALSRPAYHEAPGFARDRWGSAAGRETPYAWTGPYWKAFGRMLKHAMLAGIYSAMPEGGGVHHRYDGNRNRFAVITGITT